MNDKKTWLGVLFVCIIVFIVWQYSKPPLPGESASAFAGSIQQEKTACESLAGRLKEKGIDGRAEYDKAKAEMDALIAGIVMAIDAQETRTEGLETLLRKAVEESAAFQSWGKRQLDKGVVGDTRVDVSALLTELLKMLREGQKERNEQVKKHFESLRFRAWADAR